MWSSSNGLWPRTRPLYEPQNTPSQQSGFQPAPLWPQKPRLSVMSGRRLKITLQPEGAGACTVLPRNREAFDCKPNRNEMSAQTATGRSLPTQSLLLEQRTRKGNRWTAIRILAAPQPPQDAPAPLTLAERIERMEGAMTAEQLAKILNVSKITIFKQAKAGRIPSFRIGTCVRFDPRAVAKWLRTM